MKHRHWISLITAGLLSVAPAAHANNEALIRLLEKRSCARCNLADADLVHADLRDANLQGSQLQRANLSQARLDGARLNGADLSFTSLLGASLRGADLRGARLEGTDLRQADLSGTQLDPGALSRTHWQQAKGLGSNNLDYAALHNAGVEAAQNRRFKEAEGFFSDAIRKQPDSAISWAARGITRSELGNPQMASSDFAYASQLYALRGETDIAQELMKASGQIKKSANKNATGNGFGNALLTGAIGAFKMLAPIAAKAFMGAP